MSALARLLLRTHSKWVLGWAGLAGALSVATLSSYVSTYRDAAAREAAVAAARADGTSTLLYGHLPATGTPAQVFAWELGTFLTVLAAVAAVLTATRVSRAAEDAGTVEVLRASGVGRSALMVSALVVLATSAVLLGVAVGGGLLVAAGDSSGVDLPGAAALGCCIGLTHLWVATLTLVGAQVVPSATSTRAVGGAAVAVAFAARAYADTQGRGWLSWASPLGLRAVVRPFDGDRWAAALPAVAACLLLGAVAVALDRRRELGSGLLSTPERPLRRLEVASPARLAWRLQRATVLWWTLGVGVGGALFTAMGSDTVEAARRGDLAGGLLGSQVQGDPVEAYLRYVATVVGILVGALALLLTLRAVHEERAGHSETLRGCGASAGAVLTGPLRVAVAGAALVLATTAALVAPLAPALLGGDGVARTALSELSAPWSAVLAVLAPAVLLAGWRPRLAWLAWAPYGASAGLALLGGLLGVPDRIVSAGAFAPPDGVLMPLARTVVFAVAVVLAVRAVGRRDLVLG